MEDIKNSIQHMLVPSFLTKRGSVKVSSHTARININATFGDEDLIRAMVNVSGAKGKAMLEVAVVEMRVQTSTNRAADMM